MQKNNSKKAQIPSSSQETTLVYSREALLSLQKQATVPANFRVDSDCAREDSPLLTQKNKKPS